MQRQSKKRVRGGKRPEVWINPEIRKLLTPYRAEISYPEFRQSGFGKAMLRQMTDAQSSDKA